MNPEEIVSFLNEKLPSQDAYVKIDFKKRDSIYGLFIRDKDFNELKGKNFWRIVTRNHFDTYKKSRDNNLARIFNGAEFSKLTSYQESFD
ncbi:MAG TPA: short-chain dehydrogenase [Chitinophagaceae bacterium]